MSQNTGTEYSKIKPTNVAPVKSGSIKEEIAAKDVKQDGKHVQLEPSTTGKVRKKTLVERLVSSLIGPNGLKSVGAHVGHNIIMPAIKQMTANALKAGVDQTIFGQPQQPNNSQFYNPQNYAQGSRPPLQQYNAQYRQPASLAPTEVVTDYSRLEFTIRTYEEAQYVLGRLRDHLGKFGVVTMAQYYNLINQPTEVTHYNWGWNDLTAASVRGVQGGYVIDFPPVEAV